ncbi:lipopolysaccharide transport periplasmic protein LptA [Campylobacter sp. FMV-PI01]|uniref:Lipopolysaccharide transport periplasmic protein LptA n=1 Tax=Campylobacter portucalensis TaxID=2608384 RepID=A0A6L5WID3_9BACT|nr:lipopolysaccharide transport periplasmic protein LptA [Campylobacter portucalensis]MSN96017.1 lipopolysaccharide transport periplasmic protein LptA [Campylobacter portucalensis]
MVSHKIALISILFIFSGLFAQEIEIVADNFFADEIKKQSILSGNVFVKKSNLDTLKSDKITIYFDDNKQPLRYIATGNVKFEILIDNNKYNGHGDKLTYISANKKYILEGSAWISDIKTKREVFGDEITINQLEGKYEVKSLESNKTQSKKPVKFIFKVKE